MKKICLGAILLLLLIPLGGKGLCQEGISADPALAGQMTEKLPGLVLDQNYPNPFSDHTLIKFTLPEDAHIHLALYNSLGTQVKMLIDDIVPSGTNSIRLDAAGLRPGIYFYQLRTDSISRVRRLVIKNSGRS